MAKVSVTKELAEKIKELRLINKVKAIDVAEHISKSSAYISRLENGDIKTVDYDELLKIFYFISKDENELEKFIDKLTLELDYDELDEQIWFMNFDTVERKIPVPSGLIDYINKKMIELDISIPQLVEYINKNEEIKDMISKHNLDLSKYKNNLWYPYEFNDEKTKAFIIMKLDETSVANVLEKKNDISNYVTILSIVYNLLRLEQELITPLNEEVNNAIKKEVSSILKSYKFYTTKEKNMLIQAAVTQKELDSQLNEFDIKNRKIVNELIDHIRFLSDWNVKYTNEKLNSVNENFKWDSSFTLSIASLPYHKLNDISKSLRSNFLKDVVNLIEEYKNKPETEKTIEAY